MFYLENYYALLFLLLLPLFYLLRKLGVFTHILLPLNLSDWEGKTYSYKKKVSGFVRFIAKFLTAAGFIALIIALASPVMTHSQKIYTSHGSEFIFVVDTSPSMAAKDMNGKNRLESAKETITGTVANSGGSTFGLISMGADSALIVPPTQDTDFFTERLTAMQTGEMGDGTAIGTGIATAVYHLVSSEAPKKCIVLITDGENNAGSIHPTTAAKLAEEKNIVLYIIGVGTKGTVPIEYTDPTTGKLFSGHFDSNFNEQELIRLAATGKGQYFYADNSELFYASIKQIAEKQGVVQTYRIEKKLEYLYLKFAVAALVMLLVSWILRRFFLKEFL
ncbi:MAG: VWA domain-containing protein [Spirochaetaceae bacterium]|nr:VWA domain-containing protein [Spirochaetaceae bacterium]